MNNPKLEKKQEIISDLHANKNKLTEKRDRQKRLLAVAIQISTIAWTTVANIAVGVFLGYWLDKLLSTQPVFTILLSLSGVVASILYLFRFARKH